MNRTVFGQSFLALFCILLASSGLQACGSELPQDQPAKTVSSDEGAEKPKGDSENQKPADQAKVAADKKDTAGKTDDAVGKTKDGADKTKEKKAEKKDWKPLKGSWVEAEFGGDGPVEIKDDSVKVKLGDPLTGVRWEGELVRENYEIELEARRTDGFDFFCALTFPVGKDHVSFVLGGWGGGIVGISSVDGRDASDNQTTSFRNFDNDKWYKVRVRVEPNEICCYIDDKLACDHIRKGHEFDIRYEMDQCVPIGLAAFQCDAEYRNIRWRKMTDKEIAEAKKKK